MAEAEAVTLSAAESRLLECAAAGDTAGVVASVKDVPVHFQDPVTGESALMKAAAGGHDELVSELLQRGAPWNAVDRNGMCAGEHALKNGHQNLVDQLVAAGVQVIGCTSCSLRTANACAVQAELMFAAIERNTHGSLLPSTETGYLGRKVSYDTGDLIDDDGRGVMMAWEGPLMVEHAEILCRSGGDVLNVGFGMGLIDTAIQKLQPRSHTIIEAHPQVTRVPFILPITPTWLQVYQKMIRDGWDKKPNVRIIFSRYIQYLVVKLDT